MSTVASRASPSAPNAPTSATRAWVKARREELERRYLRRPDPKRTLEAHAAFVDEILQRLWSASIDDPRIALVAVGGYGRGALYPHSDVDVLVLLPDARVPEASIERFVGALWDCGLDLGHSVRTITQSIEEAAKDVTVDTSLIEARHVAGDPALLAELERRLRERRSVRAFF